MIYKDGEPCGHRGCLNHVTHPCEGCGRIEGKTVKRKCIKCGTEDKRINGQDKAFCEECLKQIIKPVEPFDMNELSWD